MKLNLLNEDHNHNLSYEMSSREDYNIIIFYYLK